jgi:hypothetical protein
VGDPEQLIPDGRDAGIGSSSCGPGPQEPDPAKLPPRRPFGQRMAAFCPSTCRASVAPGAHTAPPQRPDLGHGTNTIARRPPRRRRRPRPLPATPPSNGQRPAPRPRTPAAAAEPTNTAADHHFARHHHAEPAALRAPAAPLAAFGTRRRRRSRPLPPRRSRSMPSPRLHQLPRAASRRLRSQSDALGRRGREAGVDERAPRSTLTA